MKIELQTTRGTLIKGLGFGGLGFRGLGFRALSPNPMGPSNGIVYTLGAQVPTKYLQKWYLDPFFGQRDPNLGTTHIRVQNRSIQRSRAW